MASLKSAVSNLRIGLGLCYRAGATFGDFGREAKAAIIQISAKPGVDDLGDNKDQRTRRLGYGKGVPGKG